MVAMSVGQKQMAEQTPSVAPSRADGWYLTKCEACPRTLRHRGKRHSRIASGKAAKT